MKGRKCMDIFNVLSLIGGLSLFLFGMNIMGSALERRAGGSLKTLLGRLTDKKIAGLLTGLGVTAVIQSSSATTVMVVGFVNSGLMTLKQSINVIMGANIGTTVTAWILSLAGIESNNVFVRLLKPSSFTPVLALIGIIFYMFSKKDKRKDTGMILLGFATLMFGMESMSSSVSGLKNVPGFQQMFLMFTNPVLGVLAGAILTAIIQSSSASVGILQALASTGSVTYGAAIPIIMGQNIGTCVTALLSCVGANKNAKRAALVHLSFNVIGTAIWLSVFCIIKLIFAPAVLGGSASLLGIAIIHSVFNVLCTLLMLPMSGLLEKLVCKLVPDAKSEENVSELDERLLATPAVALERCRLTAVEMADCSAAAMREALTAAEDLTPELSKEVRKYENRSDHYEDILGTYLVKLSGRQISETDSAAAAELLKMIGDFERISDHAVEVVAAAEEMRDKGMSFTADAQADLKVISSAVAEVLDLSVRAFANNDLAAAEKVTPLETVIYELKENLRSRHIQRMQQGRCTIEAGFVWSDLLTALERTADHCANIAGCVTEIVDMQLDLHAASRRIRQDDMNFGRICSDYRKKYQLA